MKKSMKKSMKKAAKTTATKKATVKAPKTTVGFTPVEQAAINDVKLIANIDKQDPELARQLQELKSGKRKFVDISAPAKQATIAEAVNGKAKPVLGGVLADWHGAEDNITPEEKAKLQKEAADKKKKALQPLTTTPIHLTIIAGGFSYTRSEQIDTAVLHGYSHSDGRAVIYICDAGKQRWTLAMEGRTRDEGTSPAELAALLKQTAKVIAEERPAIKMPAPNVTRAIEMLGSATVWKYDPAILSNTKSANRRLVIFKKLTGEDPKHIAPAAFESAFFMALGVADLPKAGRTTEFVKYCKKISNESQKIKKAAKKADDEFVAKGKAAAKLPQLPGKPPEKGYVKQTKAERKAEQKKLVQELSQKLAITPYSGPVAAPKPDADVHVTLHGLALLKEPDNGIVMLRLERSNSQGAICVYNNDQRVAAGVVPSGVLKNLRPIAVGSDTEHADKIIEAARQLLQPAVGVVVTTVAKRHLTAVLNCKEIIEMTTAKNKKFAAKKSSKKEEAEVKATKRSSKAAENGGEPKERVASSFRLRKETEKEWGAFGGQKGEIVAALKKLGAVGAKSSGATRAQLCAALPNIGTNNISFYLSKWQAPNIIEKLAAA
jgi:hypothetical protein